MNEFFVNRFLDQELESAAKNALNKKFQNKVFRFNQSSKENLILWDCGTSWGHVDLMGRVTMFTQGKHITI
jgi:hypothetical protein